MCFLHSELYTTHLNHDPPRLEMAVEDLEHPAVLITATDPRVKWTKDIDPKNLDRAEKKRRASAFRQRRARRKAKEQREQLLRLVLHDVGCR